MYEPMNGIAVQWTNLKEKQADKQHIPIRRWLYARIKKRPEGVT
jgi:hypothetical protein